MTDIEAMLDRRALDHPKVRKLLDSMTVAEVVMDLGEPEKVQRYLEPTLWHQGDPRPSLAAEDPAVTVAMAKCATTRMRRRGLVGPATDSFHPEACGFCEYPEDQLLLAVDWANWHARYLTSELLVWRQAQDGPGRHVQYVRSGRSPGYTHDAWRKFERLPAKEQRRQVLAAMEATRG